MYKKIITTIILYIIVGVSFYIPPSDSLANEENDFNLYGFSVNKYLDHTMKMAQDKGFEINVIETTSNKDEVNLILELAKEHNINVNIDNLSDEMFNRFKDTESYRWLKINYKLFNEFSEILKINFIPINFYKKDTVQIQSLFIRSKNNFYPYSILVIPEGNYNSAAKKLVEERADKKGFTNFEDGYPLLNKGEIKCKVLQGFRGKYYFLFYSQELLDGLEGALKDIRNKRNEEADRNEQTRLKQLQEGM